MTRRAACVVAALLAAGALGAQPRPLALGDVLRLARERHPALSAASARRLVATSLARHDAQGASSARSSCAASSGTPAAKRAAARPHSAPSTLPVPL